MTLLAQTPRYVAQRAVDLVSFRLNQYSVVSKENATELLGDDLTDLMSDPIKSKGPGSNTIYSWNVVDYLERKLRR